MAPACPREIHLERGSLPAIAFVKFTWNGDMPYSSVGWGLAFQVRAICLHRERESAPQVPVEGLPVPGDFHGRGIECPR